MEPRVFRVLLLDGDPRFVRKVSQGLSSFTNARIELVACDQLAEGLQRLGSEKFDAVLVDLNLSDSKGMATFAELLQPAGGLPVIVVADSDNEAVALEAVRAGAQDYLVKSRFEGRFLARVIRYAIERKRIEEDLRGSERRYRKLLASTTDYIYTVRVQDGASVGSTHGPGCLAVTGHSAEDFEEDSTLWYRMICEEDRDKVTAHISKVLSGDPVRPLEHRILHKNGSVRWIRNTPVVHKDTAGQVTGYDGLVSDVTERKEAELRLSTQCAVNRVLAEASCLTEAAPRLLEAVCENLGWEMGALWRADKEARALRVEATWHRPDRGYAEVVEGLRQAEFGRGISFLGHIWASGRPAQSVNLLEEEGFPLAEAAVKAGLWVAFGFPIAVNRTVLGVLSLFSGQVHPIEPMVPMAVSIGGQIGQFVLRKQAADQLVVANQELVAANEQLSRNEDALRRTLAELRASHSQLRSAQKLLMQAEKLESIGTLAAGVAHEVKNPLQTILMGVDFLTQHAPAAGADVQIALKEMREAVQRADSIVRELVEFSATNQPQMKAESLNDVVEHALTLMKYELIRGHVSVIRELATGLPVLPLDRNKMQQAFVNLLLNAIQAMPQGGTLTVRTGLRSALSGGLPPAASASGTEEQKAEVVAEVEDTGPGIPESHMSRVFDPFFTTKPPGVGTGLGLPVTQRIVELHRGSIQAANRPGGGARFSIHFNLNGRQGNEPKSRSDCG